MWNSVVRSECTACCVAEGGGVGGAEALPRLSTVEGWLGPVHVMKSKQHKPTAQELRTKQPSLLPPWPPLLSEPPT